MLPDINMNTGLLEQPKCGLCDQLIIQLGRDQPAGNKGDWVHGEDLHPKAWKDSGVLEGLGVTPQDKTGMPEHKAFPHDSRTDSMTAASDELMHYQYGTDEEHNKTRKIEPKLGELTPQRFINPNLGDQYK
jgi:hypothetical protein